VDRAWWLLSMDPHISWEAVYFEAKARKSALWGATAHKPKPSLLAT